MSLLSSLPEREEKEKRVTSGLRNCVLYPSILSPVSESASFVNSFVLFFAFLVWMVAERIGRGEELNPKFQTVFLGKNPAPKSDDFLEKFQTAYDAPPSFLENYVAIFFIMDMVAYMLEGMRARQYRVVFLTGPPIFQC